MSSGDHAEQRPLVGAFDARPALAVVAGTEHAALFANDKQARILDAGNSVEVQLIGVVQPLGDVLPVLAAIGGLDQGAIGTHGKSMLGIEEGHVEQWCFAREVFELFAPVAPPSLVVSTWASWPTAQPRLSSRKNTAVSNCRVGTGPGSGLALVVGEQDMATVADHH